MEAAGGTLLVGQSLAQVGAPGSACHAVRCRPLQLLEPALLFLQDTPLYSSDGSVFLILQSRDGNLVSGHAAGQCTPSILHVRWKTSGARHVSLHAQVLYNTGAYAQNGESSAAAIWGAASYANSAPYKLTMQPVCTGNAMPAYVYLRNTPCFTYRWLHAGLQPGRLRQQHADLVVHDPE